MCLTNNLQAFKIESNSLLLGSFNSMTFNVVIVFVSIIFLFGLSEFFFLYSKSFLPFIVMVENFFIVLFSLSSLSSYIFFYCFFRFYIRDYTHLCFIKVQPLPRHSKVLKIFLSPFTPS